MTGKTFETAFLEFLATKDNNNTPCAISSDNRHPHSRISLTCPSPKNDLKTRLIKWRNIYQKLLGFSTLAKKSLPEDTLRRFFNELCEYKSQELQERLIISPIQGILIFMLESKTIFRGYLSKELVSMIYMDTNPNSCDLNFDLKTLYNDLLLHLSGRKTIHETSRRQYLELLDKYKCRDSLLHKTRGLLCFGLFSRLQILRRLRAQTILITRNVPNESLTKSDNSTIKKELVVNTSLDDTEMDSPLKYLLSNNDFLTSSSQKTPTSACDDNVNQFSQDLFSDATKDLFDYAQQNSDMMNSLLNTQNYKNTVPQKTDFHLEYLEHFSQLAISKDLPKNMLAGPTQDSQKATMKAEGNMAFDYNYFSAYDRGDSPVLNNFSKRIRKEAAKNQEIQNLDESMTSLCMGFDGPTQEPQQKDTTENQSCEKMVVDEKISSFDQPMSCSEISQPPALVPVEKSNISKREYFVNVKNLKEAREDVKMASARISQPDYFTKLFAFEKKEDVSSNQIMKSDQNLNKFPSVHSFGSDRSSIQNKLKREVCNRLKEQLLKYYHF